ncbi:MAG: hypothetical protein ACRD38_08755 [Nitrososphaerales archaeon]
MEDVATDRMYDSSEFVITKRRWNHVLEHHPELSDSVDTILEAIRNPDEVYVDPRGTYHILRRTRKYSDYIVVICKKNGGKTYLTTAHYTSSKRKERRYRTYTRQKLS